MPEVKQQINAASKISKCFKQTILKNKGITTECATKLYKPPETRAKRVRTRQLLMAIEMLPLTAILVLCTFSQTELLN